MTMFTSHGASSWFRSARAIVALLELLVGLTQHQINASSSLEIMSLIKSTLEQLKADRSVGMPKTARFSEYTGSQLDAIEGVLSLLLNAEALGAAALANVDEVEAHGDANFDRCEARESLKALRGAEDIRKVPRR